MPKTTRRFVLVFDAQFGTDPDDPYDKDDNAYDPTMTGAPNILAALDAGQFGPGHEVYVELGGDLVSGTLVSIKATPKESP